MLRVEVLVFKGFAGDKGMCDGMERERGEEEERDKEKGGR